MTKDVAQGRLSDYLMLIGAGILWSTGGVLIKWIEWHPLAIAGMRSLISAVVLLGLIRKPKFSWSISQVGGAIAFSATVMLFVTSTKLTTAANAVLLQYTAPIYTAVFAGAFLQERTQWYDWLAVVVVFGGIVLFFFDGLTFRGTWGSILAALSGVSWAWVGLFLRKQRRGSPFESVLLGHIITGIIGIPFMCKHPPTSDVWPGMVLLGVFQMGLSYYIYARAIKRVRALDAMLVLTIEPVLNPMLVFLFIGEVPGRMALIGGGVVLFMITTRSIMQLRRSGR
ncbi:MAG: EamA family transporter [Spirochaetes bacterium]|nr:EamA family transporter [Spirochaetota bacterium]